MWNPTFQRYRSTSEADLEPSDARRPNKKYLRKRHVTFGGVEEIQYDVKCVTCTGYGGRGISVSNGLIYCVEHRRDKGQLEDETKQIDLNESIKTVDVRVENKDTDDRGSILTIGKKGKGVGEFQDATHIAPLSNGHILVTDMVNNRLQRINKLGETVDIYTSDEIKEPVSSCATHDGHFALTSRRLKCVLIISSSGELLWSFGSEFFQAPSGICVDEEGNFIVTDVKSDRVSLHKSSGQFIRYFGEQGVKEQQFNKPRHVCISTSGEVIVSDSGNHAIKVFDRSGDFIRSFGKFGNENGKLKTPYGVCSDKYGQVIVADHYNNRISLYTISGHFIRHLICKDDGIVHPQCVTVSANMELFVSHGHLKASEIKVFKLVVIDKSDTITNKMDKF